ncbi:hypothetical protein DFH09DRAFT_1173004 [Mycena vulgaris]|nr:hypothetical protein DFH09DRAFT_1173004 [Mycena vulgaris]
MPGGPGQYHPFPNDHWNDLRAETPFTSPPLDDDFDAITQRWSRTTRATTVDPTASRLYEQLEAATRATTPAVPGFTNPRRRRKASNGGAEPRKEQAEVVVAPGKSLRRMRGKDRIKSGSANGSANGHTRVAPLAGQDYEMVEYRVLEEGVDRTVSISTWREQAIQETDSDDEMSFVPLPLRRMGEGSNNSGGESSRSLQNPATSAADKLTSSPNTGRNYSGTKTYRARASPRTSTPRGSGTLVVQNVDASSRTLLGSPFHATKSGSTISSIQLTPGPTLEQVLSSCQPSLAHIYPILQRVGIMRAEHLRAVGKLSEDTRNREVKEEVLRLGVTVVEWAILLDRLQAL